MCIFKCSDNKHVEIGERIVADVIDRVLGIKLNRDAKPVSDDVMNQLMINKILTTSKTYLGVSVCDEDGNIVDEKIVDPYVSDILYKIISPVTLLVFLCFFDGSKYYQCQAAASSTKYTYDSNLMLAWSYVIQQNRWTSITLHRFGFGTFSVVTNCGFSPTPNAESVTACWDLSTSGVHIYDDPNIVVYQGLYIVTYLFTDIKLVQ